MGNGNTTSSFRFSPVLNGNEIDMENGVTPAPGPIDKPKANPAFTFRPADPDYVHPSPVFRIFKQVENAARFFLGDEFVTTPAGSMYPQKWVDAAQGIATYPSRVASERRNLTNQGVSFPKVSDNAMQDATLIAALGHQALPPQILAKIGLQNAFPNNKEVINSIQFVPNTNPEKKPHIVFTHPQTRQPTVFNVPGPDFLDFYKYEAKGAELIKDLAVFIGTSATIKKLLPKSGGATRVSAIATTEAASSYLFTLYRLNQFRQQGKVPLTQFSDQQMHNIARNNALMTGGVALAVPTMMYMWKKIINRPPPAGLGRDLTEQELDDAIAFEKNIQDELRRRYPDAPEINLTAAQATGDPLLLQYQRVIPLEANKPLQEVMDRQNALEDFLLDDFFPQQTNIPGQDEQIRQALEIISPVDHTVAKTKKGIEKAIATASTAITKLFTSGPTQFETGTGLQEALGGSRQQLFDTMSGEYEAFKLNHNLKAASEEGLDKIREVALSVKGVLDDDLFKSITRDYDNLFGEATLVGKEPIVDSKGKIVKIDGEVQYEDVPVTFGQLSRALSDLKYVLRSPGISSKTSKDVGELIKVISEVRRDMFGGDTVIENELANLDKAWRRAKEIYDYGIVGEILKQDQAGNFLFPAQNIVKKILGREDLAHQFGQILKDDSVPGVNQMRYRLKEGVIDLYRTEVMGTDLTAPVGYKEHGDFANKYNESLELLVGAYDQDFIKTFRQAEAAANVIRVNQQSANDLTKFLAEKWNFLPEDLTPQRIREIAKVGDMDKVEEFYSLLTNFPHRQQVVKDLLAETLRFDMTIPPQGGVRGRPTTEQVRTFDVSKFSEIFDGPDGARNLRMARLIGGQPYINNLRWFAKEVLPTMRPELRDVPTLGAESPGNQTINNFLVKMARAGTMPPLTRRGRFFTATLQKVNERKMKLISEILASPQKLHTYRRFSNRLMDNPETQAILSVLGLTAIRDEEDGIKNFQVRNLISEQGDRLLGRAGSGE